jgi:hypothetical protein
MVANPYKPPEIVPRKRTLAEWFGTLSRAQRACALAGLVLFVWGTAPMFGALVVANRAIADGPHAGDYELMEEWDWWAFSPRFVGLTLCGVGIVVAALLWKKAGWRYAAIAFIFVTVLFAYDAHERRKLIPPDNLTLDSYFEWQPTTKWAAIKESGGAEYLILLGPPAGFLPSGGSAYVFDKSGQLIDWVTDTGDSVRFKRRWLQWSGIPIDRQAAQDWLATP